MLEIFGKGAFSDQQPAFSFLNERGQHSLRLLFRRSLRNFG